jgi:hypothetical protein
MYEQANLRQIRTCHDFFEDTCKSFTVPTYRANDLQPAVFQRTSVLDADHGIPRPRPTELMFGKPMDKSVSAERTLVPV